MSAATAAEVVRFLGLSDVADTASGREGSFPLGILYPYSRDLQRVCSCYDDLCREEPGTAATLLDGRTAGASPGAHEPQAPTLTAFLAAIATLHGRIAFAPGPAGASVAAAFRLASDAVGSA
jgi:hypothetical protein